MLYIIELRNKREDMKKIAIIIQNLNGGGAERTAANLSLYFQKSMKYILLFLMGGLLAIHTVERFMI